MVLENIPYPKIDNTYNTQILECRFEIVHSQLIMMVFGAVTLLGTHPFGQAVSP
jgi:hypothetical protein